MAIQLVVHLVGPAWPSDWSAYSTVRLTIRQDENDGRWGKSEFTQRTLCSGRHFGREFVKDVRNDIPGNILSFIVDIFL